MTLQTQLYLEQRALWPRSGRHILAQFDANSIWVYQAYNARIGELAAHNGRFGGDFSFERMSWIKPNFLWMMYRSGWGEKPNQTTTLAIRLPRALWDEILFLAVPSSFVPELFVSQGHWKREVAQSEARLQWDPDHDPRGHKCGRRAVQLGLRGALLRRFVDEALAIEDISEFVAEQRSRAHGNWNELMVPRERVYPVENAQTAWRLGLEVEG